MKKRLPDYTIVLAVVLYLVTLFVHHNWTRDKGPERGVIKWDVISYYAYLPATFIYHDISLEFVKDPNFKNDEKFWFQKTGTGKNIIITSMGLSYLYAPFFFMAHLLAPVFNEPKDGFHSIYQFFLVFGSLVYVVLGLLILKSVLLRFFSVGVTAITLLLVAAGTNLYFYTTHEAAMSHAYSFMLITLLLYLVIMWYDRPAYWMAALLGLVFGLIVLIRPSNIVVLIVILLWGVSNWRSLGDRVMFFLRRSPLVLLMICCFLLPWIPQFIYWKAMTGSFLYNSYEQVGSAFYFDHPHVSDFLFSYRKGWFIYTPVMFLACLGFIPLFRKLRGSFIGCLLYLVLMVYILSSWWSWWYGGSFGIRAMVDTYAVMAIPLAAVTEWTLRLKRHLGAILLSIMTFLLFLNIFQTWQYTHGRLHWVGMTKDSYLKSFLRISPVPGYWQNLSMPDFELARKGIYVNYPTGDKNEDLKAMTGEEARKIIEEQVRADRQLMSDIKRYSMRIEQPADSVIIMVVERIWKEKTGQ
jgi:hypothetical protein